jgi:hypothetical protein
VKRALLTTAALVAAVAVYAGFSLPPRPVSLPPAFDDGTVPGILHVHTNRSDGRSSPETVAAIAAGAGLRFVVFTDHGDATRQPDPPAYISGVLCLDGVEISTNGGHYVAVGMPESPYPLAGEARDVVEDVHRLGGFGIAAHPDSPKAELRWREWTAPIDGVELLNPDTSWRIHALQPGVTPKLRLVRALLTYPVRPSPTIAALLVNGSSAISEFERIAEERRIVALAGADAHAKLEIRNVDPGDNRFALELPSYRAALGVMTVRIRPSATLTGSDAAADAERLLQGLRSGHLYTAIDAWAAPPAFAFTASTASGHAAQGDEVVTAGAARLHVRSNAPAGYVTGVWQGRTRIAELEKNEADLDVTGPGVFRVEIRRGKSNEEPAWITSNPIFMRAQTRSAPAALPPRDPDEKDRTTAAKVASLFDGRTLTRWNTETDPSSLAAMDLAPRIDGTNEVRFRYGLSGGANIGQFSGATVEAPANPGAFKRIAFIARAEHPMRISIQARAAVPGAPPERWQRSVYLDAQERDIEVAFDDMTPVGQTHAPHVPREGLLNFMFIVDTTNTKPGASGRIWIRNPRVERQEK